MPVDPRRAPDGSDEPQEGDVIVDIAMEAWTLAAALDVPQAVLAHVAIQNMRIIAGYRAGQRGDAEALVRLLRVPVGPDARPLPDPLAPVAKQSEPPGASTSPSGARPRSGGSKAAREAALRILAAAGHRAVPFSSAELAASLGGVSAAMVGMILASARWPSEAVRLGYARRWLPRRP